MTLVYSATCFKTSKTPISIYVVFRNADLMVLVCQMPSYMYLANHQVFALVMLESESDWSGLPPRAQVFGELRRNGEDLTAKDTDKELKEEGGWLLPLDRLW